MIKFGLAAHKQKKLDICVFVGGHADSCTNRECFVLSLAKVRYTL